MQIHKYLCAKEMFNLFFYWNHVLQVRAGQMMTQLTHSFMVGVKVLEAKSPSVKFLDLSIGWFCMNFNPFVLLNKNLNSIYFRKMTPSGYNRKILSLRLQQWSFI